MTPKEKAKELVDRLFGITMNMNLVDAGLDRAKQCALIVVDQMIEETKEYEKFGTWPSRIAYREIYWYDVKAEIEKL